MSDLIPAIDLIDGGCVRLVQGDYASVKRYPADALEMARRFEGVGLKRLHLVDLDGARAGRPANLAVLESIAKHTRLKIDFSGGLRSREDLDAAFAAGAAQAALGSIAVKDPQSFAGWLKQYGAEKIILSADIKGESVAYAGWRAQSDLSWRDFLTGYAAQGVTWVTCTDISRDGLLGGPATELYREMLAAFPTVKLIASGGVSSLRDVELLREVGVSGIIIGKAIYEGKIGLKELGRLVR